jgi:hypothetical protein
MPQLSLYLDDKTLKKVEKAAKIENTSISKWVTGKLKEHLENEWPDNYSSLFGSISDESFCAEAIADFANDASREKL